MEFLYEKSINGRNKTIKMAHKDEVLEWTVEDYRKLTPDIYVFGDINRTLASLPEADQDAIWEAYKAIHEDFVMISDTQKLDKRIVEQFMKIETHIPYEVVARQVRADGDFWIPPDPKELEVVPQVELISFEIEENDERLELRDDISRKEVVTKTLTYTLHDYEQLNILIIYSKLFMPVLAHYTSVMRDNVPELFRCMKTIGLLDKLKLAKEEGWTRLYEYINLFWWGRKNKGSLNASILLKGMSEDNVSDWLLSELMYKRLLPIGVSHLSQDVPDSERPNFIKGLFHVVMSYSNYLTNGVRSEYFIDKGRRTGVTTSDEEQSSRLENYRVASDIQEASIVPVQVFCENIDNLLKHVDPSLPNALVEETKFSPAFHVGKHRIRTVLVQWILGKVISPGFIPHLDTEGTTTEDYPAWANCYKVTHALLVHWGFDELAKIIDSRIYYTNTRDYMFNNLDISAEQVKRLQVYYPYEIESTRAKNESKRNSNYAILACYELQDEVRGMPMHDYLNDERWTCHVDIAYQLAKLLIFMNENKFI